MSKLMSLIRRDFHNLRGNVISLVVIVGIIVVPTFYAWFNIAGSWDPYGNTKNLKVAVANSAATPPSSCPSSSTLASAS